jgi:alpha,alpha-trehalose-phosphate synthase [UDP-forming]/trehalose-phosphatase
MTSGIDPESEYWLSLARHAPLGILSDLDGTLLPFAPTPEEARPSAELTGLVADLSSLPDTLMMIVSGRPRTTLDEFFPPPRNIRIVAEHGAWRSRPDGWEPTVTVDAGAVDSLAIELGRLQSRHRAALVERKTWSVAIHYRRVPPQEKTELLVQAAAIIGPWTEAHPDFELLNGSEVLEVRPRGARKANAVTWIREQLGPTCRLLIVGDDVTDEDMFAAASPEDATVLVAGERDRATAARWQLGSIDEVHALYRWIISHRRQAELSPPSRRPNRVATLPDASAEATFDLLVLSNRLPELRSADGGDRKKNVGGLVSALAPILSSRKGIWLGWSGRTRPDATASELGFTSAGGLSLAWVDFPEAWHRHYYNGLSNSALWPLFHTFPGRIKLSHDDWRAYEAANEAFAAVATRLVKPSATIWVHDYHLLLLGSRLRAHGHKGPVGLFQHIPFPGPDVFFLLPWAHQILEAMLELDLVGFHTQPYVDNFLRCMQSLPGVRIEGTRAIRGQRSVVARPFPIGIIPEEFQDTDEGHMSGEIAGLMHAIGSARLVLGVDRLDYTKGIPERIVAFGRFLELFPEWRRKTCLVQVSVPSRGDIPEYAEQRSRVENIVGRVNGEYGEADWVPIRYLYRSYARNHLSQLYRAADVGYVTPLRDGMNLVAKEFIAAQDPEEPGVLLLSRFAGAAEELTAAVLTNPWDAEGTARDLEFSLRMPKEERVARFKTLHEVISRTTALTWAEDFLRALAESAEARASARL